MITNINKFIELLEKLNLLFSKNLVQNLENEINLTKEIEALYLEYKQIFPIDIKSSFDELGLRYNSSFEMIVWGLLKEVYFNYESFIDNDYKVFKNTNFKVSADTRKLFYHSKQLSSDFFRFLSKYYYWHYGRNKSREKMPIRVFFLNDFQRGNIHFDSDISDEDKIEKIQTHYAYKYELIEREVRYTYSTNDISLEIEQPEYEIESPLINDLKRINQEYQSKLEILKDIKNNLMKITSNLEFEFPKSVHFVENTIKISFNTPDKVFQTLIPSLENHNFIEPLRKIIFAETSISESKINFNCSSATLVYFFKQLYDNNVMNARIKEDISDWIIDNFKFYHSPKFKEFKVDTVQKTLMRSSSIPTKIIQYPY